MNDDREARIRQRAYELWLQEGCPEGRESTHWQQAAEEIGADQEMASGGEPGGSEGSAAPQQPNDQAQGEDAARISENPQAGRAATGGRRRKSG